MVDARDATARRRPGPLRRRQPGHSSGTRSPRRGLGEGAASDGTADADPTPSFDSPFANNATVTFTAGRTRRPARRYQLFVGDYEAARGAGRGHRPGDAARRTRSRSCPGTYEFVARGNGLRPRRGSTLLARPPGRCATCRSTCRATSPRRTSGATASRRRRQPRRADRRHRGDELGLAGRRRCAGKQVTVDLDPSQASHQVRRVQVSAMLRRVITATRTTRARRTGSRRCGSSRSGRARRRAR